MLPKRIIDSADLETMLEYRPLDEVLSFVAALEDVRSWEPPDDLAVAPTLPCRERP